MNRRRFITTSAAAAATVAFPRPLCSQPTAPAPSDTELLVRARARIEEHRKGAGRVILRTADGRPAADAPVRIEQLRHEFLFGCNLFRFGHVQDPAREQAYRERFAALLNYATLGFYWPMYEPQRGQPQYAYTDQVLAWTQPLGIVCKGHPLVWDFADPKWLPQDFSEIRTLSNNRVRDLVTRFKNRIDLWDVVNEPTHLGRFGTQLGRWAQSTDTISYVRESLQIAREASPGATLLVNDYRTDPPFYRILDQLRAPDGRFLYDAVGLQSHMHQRPWPLAEIGQVCDRFARLNLPIHFTETTVVSGPHIEGERWKPTTPELEAAQADYVPNLYTMVFAHPATRALTWWDFSDDGAWQGAAAGLVRADMSPKPVYDRLHDLIKGAWWTRAEASTDARGEVEFRAFYGTQRLHFTDASGKAVTRDVLWQRDQPNRFEFTV